MKTFGAEQVRDEVILAARFALILLFVVFGWSKLTNYSAAIGYMTQMTADEAQWSTYLRGSLTSQASSAPAEWAQVAALFGPERGSVGNASRPNSCRR